MEKKERRNKAISAVEKGKERRKAAQKRKRRREKRRLTDCLTARLIGTLTDDDDDDDASIDLLLTDVFLLDGVFLVMNKRWMADGGSATSFRAMK